MIQKDDDDDDELGDGDLIIKSRDGELLAKISDEEIRRAYEDAAKIKGSQFFLSAGCYAEVVVQTDGRFSRNEEPSKQSVNPEILEFYSMALTSEDPFTMYISFYHIIEYYFDEVYQKKLLDDMREKITSPDFSYKNDKKFIVQILD